MTTEAWEITQHANNEVKVDWCNNFYCLLITFANGLDPDQDRQKVGHELDSNHLTL